MKRILKIGLLTAFMLSLFATVFLQAFSVDEKLTLTATNVSDGVLLEWNEQEDIYYYEVYRQLGKAGSPSLLSKVQTATYTDTEMTSGKLYIYTVKPVFTDLTKSASPSSAAAYHLPTPEITSVTSEKEGIRVEWSVVREALGYKVFRRAEGEEEWSTIATLKKGTTAYEDKTASGSVKYFYAVTAVASSFTSEQSEEAEMSYIAYPKIIGGSSTETGISFSWTEVPDCEYYYIYRKASDKGSWKPYALLDSQYTSYEDDDADSGTAYTYIVRAVDTEGKMSHYDNGFTSRHIGIPQITKIEGAVNGVKVTWSGSYGCQGYGLYRKSEGDTNWKLVKVIKGSKTLSAVDTKVKNSAVYTYTVRAIWKNSLSAYDEVGTTFRYLQAPQKLQCDIDTASGNVLKWKGNDAASTYIVYRKDEVSNRWKVIGQTTANFFADENIVGTAKYNYTVMAYISSTYMSSYAKIVSTKAVKLNSNQKMVALTFDDGPSDVHTNGILDVLEKYNSKATFFVVGENIEYGSDALSRAAKMGCEIGTHTYSHIDLPTSSDDEIIEEITLTDDLVKKYTGEKTKVARAPGGEIDDRSASIVDKPFFYWNVDTRDWESQDADSVIDIVMSETQDGDIILMHDIYDSTASASETIIPWLINQGYQLVTVSELMEYKGIKMQNAVSYSAAY